MKKIASLIIVCALLFVNAFAQGSPEIRIDDVECSAGDTIEVNVVMENNPGIVNATFDLQYDNSAMKLVKVIDGGILGKSNNAPDINLMPYRILWENDLAKSNFTDDGILTTLVFKINDSANGTYDIALTYNKGFIFDFDLNNVDFKIKVGRITVVSDGKNDVSLPEKNDITMSSQSDDKFGGDKIENSNTVTALPENENFDIAALQTESTEIEKQDANLQDEFFESAKLQKKNSDIVFVCILVAAALVAIVAVTVIILKKQKLAKKNEKKH